MAKKLLLFAIILSCFSCQPESQYSGPLFEEINAKDSKLIFSNNIVETAQINFYRHQYIYNGGGVGIADIDNDGFSDVYLTSTQGQDKLFLNKGKFVFEDISKTAGIENYPGVKTGVNFIDINQDGYKDIYVCRAGWTKNPAERENLLFINQKDGTFSEKAKEFGINDSNCSVQSSFFDFDKDGDLDLFVSNHPQIFNEPMVDLIRKSADPPAESSDKLYRNDGNNRFTEVTASAGLSNYCYGLGMITADLNNDGWTDIYLTSDFSPRDRYYVNQRDGTFREALTENFAHCSYFAMGIDMVDINNDQSLDLFVDEMLAEDNARQKTNMAPMDMERFNIMSENGMYYQYMRNSFFINNGEGYFRDVAHYAGIDKSDWSWSCLFGDYDLDGDEDLLVANGWLKDTQDKDFNKKSNALAAQNNNKLSFDDVTSLLASTKLKNYAFEYEGDLKFKKSSDDWGFNFKGYSHGMSYGDLDNDGDLDIIVSNNNDNVSLYRNSKNTDNFVSLKLEGPKGNLDGLNTKVTLITDKKTQYKEFQNCRGFQSSVDYGVHFGLEIDSRVQKLIIEWPNGQNQVLNNIQSGRISTIKYAPTNDYKKDSPTRILEEDEAFMDLFTHEETVYNDYNDQVLIPHKLSQLGPALAKADVNGDGLEDFFIGGAANKNSRLFIQNKNGTFSRKSNPTFTRHQKYEDVVAHFFDANGDNKIDLYVGSGSSEFISNPGLQRDRLYINDGNGNFSDSSSLPKNEAVTSAVSSGDFDKDGDLDLFVGSRLLPGFYPKPSSSFIYENQDGKFIDVTKKIAPELMDIGLITTGYWKDIDKDGKVDILLAGEWTDLIYMKNDGKSFSKQKLLTKAKIGWWNKLLMKDIDGDGVDDIIAGNLGENYKYQASDDAPFEIYSDDMDENGKYDIVLGYNNDGKLFPVRGLQCSSEQIPDLGEKFPTYEEFGSADLFKVYGKALDNALHYKANCFSSAILWGNEDGTYEFQALDHQSQLAPIQDFIVQDMDNDGDLDILAIGNWHMAEVETPRADSGIGVLIENKGNRSLISQEYSESGLMASRDARKLISVKNQAEKSSFIVGNNNSAIQAFKMK